MVLRLQRTAAIHMASSLVACSEAAATATATDGLAAAAALATCPGALAVAPAAAQQSLAAAVALLLQPAAALLQGQVWPSLRCAAFWFPPLAYTSLALVQLLLLVLAPGAYSRHRTAWMATLRAMRAVGLLLVGLEAVGQRPGWHAVASAVHGGAAVAAASPMRAVAIDLLTLSGRCGGGTPRHSRRGGSVRGRFGVVAGGGHLKGAGGLLAGAMGQGEEGGRGWHLGRGQGSKGGPHSMQCTAEVRACMLAPPRPCHAARRAVMPLPLF